MAYQSFEITRLRAQQEALDKQLAEAKERETRLVLIEIVQKMREYGISLNELMGRKPGVAAIAPSEEPAAAKYRDPVSGATWSGRGRAPQWIAGKNRDEFLVDPRAAATARIQASLFPDER
jgi:DNA-binding protein H-NS